MATKVSPDEMEDEEERPASRAGAASGAASAAVSCGPTPRSAHETRSPPPPAGRRHSVDSVGDCYSVESLERPPVGLARRRFRAVAAALAIALLSLAIAPPVTRGSGGEAGADTAVVAGHLAALAAWLLFCTAALAAGHWQHESAFGRPAATAGATLLACLGIVAWANYALLFALPQSPPGVPLLVPFVTASAMRVGGPWSRLPGPALALLASFAALANTIAFAASPALRSLPHSGLALALVYVAAAEGTAAGYDALAAAGKLWEASVRAVRALDALAAIGASAAAAALERESAPSAPSAAAAPPGAVSTKWRRRRSSLAMGEGGDLDLSSPLERALRVVALVKLRAASERRVDDVHALDAVEEILAHSDNLYVPQVPDTDLMQRDETISHWLQSEIPLVSKPRSGTALNEAVLPAHSFTMNARVSISMHGRSRSTTSPLAPPTGFIASVVPMKEEAQLVRALAMAESWDFDAFAFGELTSGRPLYVLGLHLLHSSGLVSALGLDSRRVEAFMQAVEMAYKDVPYHNAVHAADVLQACHFFAKHPLVRCKLTNLDHLALILAAIGHDIGHDGRNNNFEIATGSERALIYNDRSVMENFHASETAMLLREERLNFLAPMSMDDRRALRRTTVAAILATDISQHFEHLGVFKARIQQPGFGTAPDDRALLVSAALKCADLANPARPFAICQRWAHCVMDEFYAQGDAERELGLAISPWMDRRAPQLPQCQVGFIEFLVQPLYGAWAACFPFFGPIADAAAANRRQWKAMADEVGHVPGTRRGSAAGATNPSTSQGPASLPAAGSFSRRNGSAPSSIGAIASPRAPRKGSASSVEGAGPALNALGAHGSNNPSPASSARYGHSRRTSAAAASAAAMAAAAAHAAVVARPASRRGHGPPSSSDSEVAAAAAAAAAHVAVAATAAAWESSCSDHEREAPAVSRAPSHRSGAHARLQPISREEVQRTSPSRRRASSIRDDPGLAGLTASPPRTPPSFPNLTVLPATPVVIHVDHMALPPPASPGPRP